MYVRLVRPQPRPGQAEEYMRRWQKILAPQARAMPGFRAAYFAGNSATHALTAIFIWDDQPGAVLDQAMDDFRLQCQDITTGPAIREDFMVLAEA